MKGSSYVVSLFGYLDLLDVVRLQSASKGAIIDFNQLLFCFFGRAQRKRGALVLIQQHKILLDELIDSRVESQIIFGENLGQ